MGGRIAFALVALALVAGPAAAAAQERRQLDIRVFARVGSPGQPEPVAIGDDGLVYVGTNQQDKGDADAPSKVFAYDQQGRLVREYVIRGQQLDEDHGIQGLAFDADGLLYALDRAASPRVIELDPRTGEQRDYATFRDVPSCREAGRATDCSATVADGKAGPDYAAFGPDGALYVTDIDQALIWRVRKGGGAAEVWFTDPRLESIFGPNGIHFLPDGRTLLFVQTGSNPQAGDSTTGRLYTLPVRGDGRPGELRQLWESRPFDGPDGFALARSGNIYVALAGANQIALIGPDGRERARAPASPVDNQRMEVPLNGPASAAFLGERMLVSNQTFPAANPSQWAILDVFAGEPGLELFRPRIREAPPQSRRLRLSVRPSNVRLRRPTRFSFLATIRAAGRDLPVQGVRIRFGRRVVFTDGRGAAAVSQTLFRRYTHEARARKRGLLPATARVRVAR